MKKFIKGQIVKLEDFSKYDINVFPCLFSSTTHQLSKKDVGRGFYLVKGRDNCADIKVYLYNEDNTKAVVVIDNTLGKVGTRISTHLPQTVRGRYVQPIVALPVQDIDDLLVIDSVVEYRGEDVVVECLYNEATSMLYFVGLDSQWFKSKAYIDSVGRVRGFATISLSPRKEKRLHTVAAYE